MDGLRAQLADPSNDADDREELLVDAMCRTLRMFIASGTFDGDVVTALHSSGFTAAEVIEYVPDVRERVFGKSEAA
jgi:hypothetical protein